MKIHEYQAKEILKSYDVPVPDGRLATTADEARSAAAELGGAVVVKAQIHAGGRGKGGGIKIAQEPRRSPWIRQGHDRKETGHASDRP